MTIPKERLFEEILAEHGGGVRSMARSWSNGDDPRDLEQEILLELWKSLDHYRGRSSRATWCYRVALHTAVKYTDTARRLAAEPYTPAAEPIIFSNRDPECVIRDFARSLAPRDRGLFMMCFDDTNYRVMAKARGVDTETLRMRVSRLKHRFARFVGVL